MVSGNAPGPPMPPLPPPPPEGGRGMGLPQALAPLARPLSVLLVVDGLLAVATAVLAVLDLAPLSAAAAGARPVDEAVAVGEVRRGVAALFQFGFLLGTAVLFFAWFFRAYRNLVRLRRPHRFSPGWAIGAWFVPILNLFRPKQMMNDLWWSSASPPAARGTPVPAFLQAWWVALLSSSLADQLALQLRLEAESVRDLIVASQVDIVAALLDTVLAGAAFLLVAVLTARLDGASATGRPAAADGDRGTGPTTGAPAP